ncbi:MAG: hypothetical protein COA70_13335 [Planctomycetota bacterium]|nr:MAG: hypothetical protein COA70_13335 [Planctomycetota bacterium]
MNTTFNLLLVGLFLSVPLSASAQKDIDEDALQFDPYTRNERAAMAEAGYRKIGVMPWADGHTTQTIDRSLGGVPILWLETEHFRIGCSLDSYTPDKSDPMERKKLKAELNDLRELLPSVPRKVKLIDPWLRMHLTARRAEDLYAQMEEILNLGENDFPDPASKISGRKTTLGPYLGMQNKFTILMTNKKSTLERYQATFCSYRSNGAMMYYFPDDEVLIFGLAAEFDGMGSDTAMHCMLSYGLTINLLNGYLAFRHSMPAWLSLGLAHSNARKIDHKRNYFSEQRAFDRSDKKIWDWEVRVRGRVKNEADPSFSEMAGWADHPSMSFTDGMIAWARVDYLRREHPRKLAEFLRVVKSPFPSGVEVTVERLQTHQVDVFHATMGMTPEEFDENWRAWVLKNYRKK